MKHKIHQKQQSFYKTLGDLLPFGFFVVMPLFLLFISLFAPSCKKEKDEMIPLKVTAVEPPAAYYGDTIAIVGQGYSPDIVDGNQVIFAGNENKAQVIAEGSSTEKLMVVVPDGAVNGPITVMVNSTKETVLSPEFYVSKPEVLKYEPDSAWAGDTIQVYGKNFLKDFTKNTVKLGTVELDKIKMQGDTLLYVILPFGAETGKIAVLGAEGPEFKVRQPEILSLAPSQAGVGDTVTVTGNGLFLAKDLPGGLSLGGQTLTVIAGKSTGRYMKAVVNAGTNDGNLSYSGNGNTITGPVFTILPTIKTVSPLNGIAGMTVTITGYNLGSSVNDNLVRFNGQTALVTNISKSDHLFTLEAKVPAGTTDGPVTVTANNRVATGPEFRITSDGTPVIFGVSPASGAPGSSIIINGDYFGTTGSQNSVTFGGNVQGTVLTASRTQLTVRIPQGAQSGAIQVTTGGKTGTGPDVTITTRSKPGISSLSPSYVTAGMEITIFGVNFPETGDQSKVSINISGSAVTACTPTSITCTLPADLKTGEYNLSVEVYGQVSDYYSLTISGIPSIISLSPDHASKGSSISLTATNFHNKTAGNTVKFGTTEAIINSVNTLTGVFSVVVPDITPGSYNVALSAFGNTSNTVAFMVDPTVIPKKPVYYWGVNSDNKNTVVKIDPALGASNVYSRNTGNGNVVVVDRTSNKVYFDDGTKISRKNLTDAETVVPEVLFTAAAAVNDITVTTNAIFWCAANKIYKGELSADGNPVGTASTIWTGAAGTIAYGMVYVNDKLYWCVYSTTSSNVAIKKGTASGTAISDEVTLYTTANSILKLPYEMKIDASAGKLVVVDRTSTSGNFRILSGDINGSNALTEIFAYTANTDFIRGMGLDTDNKYIYWLKRLSDYSTSVWRCDYQGAANTVEEVYTALTNKSTQYSGLDVVTGASQAKSGRLRLASKFNNLDWLK